MDEIEAGRYAGCQVIVYNLSENSKLARKYRVKVVPTVIIDGEAKIQYQNNVT